MSIVLFTSPIFNGNAGAGEVTAASFVLRLACQRLANGRVTTKDVPFTIIGPPAATREQIEDAGAKMAGRLAKMSQGVIMGLYLKLGKYRNDEAPGLLSGMKKEYGTVIQSNNPKVEDPTSTGLDPYRKMTVKVFVPWLEPTVSRQDMRETAKAPIGVDGLDFYLGDTRFSNEDKDSLTGFSCEYNAGVTVKEYTRTADFQLTNTDVDVGHDDHVVSEAPHVIVEGVDELAP